MIKNTETGRFCIFFFEEQTSLKEKTLFTENTMANDREQAGKKG